MQPLLKDIFREIKGSMGRFVSLIIITALGASSVIGIQASAIDMRDIADKTYKENALYDIQLKSTMGFDEDDIAALMTLDEFSVIMPTCMTDVYANIQGESRAVRAYALPDGLNKISIIEGRLPDNADECAVESRFLRQGGYAIGDTIELSLDDMDDYYDVLCENSFIITGVVSSPLFISVERGNTTIGNGSLDYYLYLHPDAYALEVYTDVYISVDYAKDMYQLSDEYDDAAKQWARVVEGIGNERVAMAKQELYDAQTEIDDGWIEYNDGYRELDEKLAEAQAELDDAWQKLLNAKTELEDAQITLDEALLDGENEIAQNERELRNGQAEIDAQMETLNAGQLALEASAGELAENLAQIEAMGPRGASAELDAMYAQIEAGMAEIEANRAELEAGYAALAVAQQQIDDGRSQIVEARRTLESERSDAQKEIDDGWREYEEGLVEYQDGVQTLKEEKEDALAELDDAKIELLDAQQKLDDAPEPEWFYFTRVDGTSFDSYYQDTMRLQKIGYVFPMVFFLVAILVSLTTMTRMVEDHRTQIGVYKALGYRPAAIMLKYLIYAFASGAIGGALGIVIGTHLFPIIITDAYGHLYDIPPIDRPIPALIAAVAMASAIAAVVVVTLLTCGGSMLDAPASLMRPKAPRAGKRVLIERISFIWNHLGFIGKVTARNVFRYKRRFLMTLVGVAGCTALLLTAFGLRDSVGGVARLQYSEIIKYDTRAYLKDIRTENQRDALNTLLPDSRQYLREESIDAHGAAGSLSASLIVPENADALSKYISLFSPTTGLDIALTDEGALVSEKLARMIGVSAGDSFTLKLGDGRSYAVTISDIVENYVLHFVYLSPTYYQSTFESEAIPNSVLLFGGKEEAFAEELLKNDDVRAVIHTANLLENLSDSTDALGIVTVVLLVLACALAFVVLFNLTNINITERIRELATIKVLGFQDGEVAMYVYRENAAVTLMGIALGLVAGIFLNSYVLSSVEIDLLKFPQKIEPLSFLLAAVISILFAIFVNWVMRFKLSAIDMVESLKNVE